MTSEELLQFPCDFPLRIMGVACPELLDEVMTTIQKHAPGDYQPQVHASAKGNYHAIRVTIRATSREQLDALYHELVSLPHVKVVL